VLCHNAVWFSRQSAASQSDNRYGHCQNEWLLLIYADVFVQPHGKRSSWNN
jgi:hypothetical protein